MKTLSKEPVIKKAVISEIKKDIQEIMKKYDLDNRSIEYAVVKACNDIIRNTDIY